MNPLTASNLEDTSRLEKKCETISKEDWDKMNRTMCGLIRSFLIQDIKYHVLYGNIYKAVVGDLGEEMSNKKHRVAFAIKEEALSFSVEKRTLH